MKTYKCENVLLKDAIALSGVTMLLKKKQSGEKLPHGHKEQIRGYLKIKNKEIGRIKKDLLMARKHRDEALETAKELGVNVNDLFTEA